MVRDELKNLSYEELNELVEKDIPVVGVYLENLDLKQLSVVKEYLLDSKLVFENSAIKKINMNSVIFTKNVEFKNCILGHADFKEMVFNKNLTIENCTFKKRLSLEYLAVEQNVTLNNVTFEEYVDFSPASFCGDVLIKNCKFLKGTSLLSRLVTFEKEPVISDCEGNLKVYDDFFDDEDEDVEVI